MLLFFRDGPRRLLIWQHFVKSDINLVCSLENSKHVFLGIF